MPDSPIDLLQPLIEAESRSCHNTFHEMTIDKGRHRMELSSIRKVIALSILASITYSGVTVAADEFYYRVRAPKLGVGGNLSPYVSGDFTGVIGKPLRAKVLIPDDKNKAPYNFSVTSGALPSGIALDNSTGDISGEPNDLGVFSATITVSGRDKYKGSTAYEVAVRQPLDIISPIIVPGVIGDQYSAKFVASGGDGRYVWSFEGEIPPGMTFSDGILAGKPSKVGVFSDLVVVVTDGSGNIKKTSPFSVAVTELTRVVSANRANLDLESLFGSSDWIENKPKRVVISSGVVVYSDDASLPAVKSGNNWGGSLTLQVNGEVQGAGGLGGVAKAGSTSGKGENGGDAILVEKAGLIVINNGAIRAGGGGGGAGGSGSTGIVNTGREPESGSLFSRGANSSYCQISRSDPELNTLQFKDFNHGWIPNTSSFVKGDYEYFCGRTMETFGSLELKEVYRVSKNSTLVTTTGGIGGFGGNGRGHNHGVTGGGTGQAGEKSAGNGGAGGAGGDWGVSGSNGIDGGQAACGANGELCAGGVGFKGGLGGYALTLPVHYNGDGVIQGRMK